MGLCPFLRAEPCSPTTLLDGGPRLVYRPGAATRPAITPAPSGRPTHAPYTAGRTGCLPPNAAGSGGVTTPTEAVARDVPGQLLRALPVRRLVGVLQNSPPSRCPHPRPVPVARRQRRRPFCTLRDVESRSTRERPLRKSPPTPSMVTVRTPSWLPASDSNPSCSRTPCRRNNLLAHVHSHHAVGSSADDSTLK